MRVVCIDFKHDSFKEACDLHSFAESCYEITPQIALGENWIFLEISRSRKLFSENQVLQFLKKLLHKWQVDAQIQIAEDIPTSLAKCRYPNKNKQEFPIEALSFYLQPFRSTKCFNESLLIFHKLGIKSISEVLKIPKQDLILRLGKTLALTLRYFDEAHKIPWPLFNFKENIQESSYVDEDYNFQNLEPLLFFLRPLLDRFLNRLRVKDLSVTEMEICLSLEKFRHISNHQRVFNFYFPFPQIDTNSILSMIRSQLENELDKISLESPVRKIELKIIKSALLSQSQPDFFHQKEEEIESMKSLVSKLMVQLGKENVFFAEQNNSYLPEKSWRKQSHFIPMRSQALLPCGDRPQRLLSKPLPIINENGQLKVGDKIFHSVKETSIERIFSHWWENEEEREYREIHTEESLRLWAFKKRPTNQLYLHGIFD
jgi:hypothetical protein